MGKWSSDEVVGYWRRNNLKASLANNQSVFFSVYLLDLSRISGWTPQEILQEIMDENYRIIFAK